MSMGSKRAFRRIGLMGRTGVLGVPETLNALVAYLDSQKLNQELNLVTETQTAKMISAPHRTADIEALVTQIDLMIVVGGDGSLLNAAHHAANHELPVLGINRGRLGFLTDIHPQHLHEVGEILNGQFFSEQRSLLAIEHQRHQRVLHQGLALNEAVLLPGDVAQMIEFDLLVNEQFVCHHRADGMIIATPTGSTAYALSGGGPILHPELAAMVLVPMFPHTLSSRPIVISDSSHVILKISSHNEKHPYLSTDGLSRIAVHAGDEIHIKRHPKTLKLIHPNSYRYFQRLREKLHWEKQASRSEH